MNRKMYVDRRLLGNNDDGNDHKLSISRHYGMAPPTTTTYMNHEVYSTYTVYIDIGDILHTYIHTYIHRYEYEQNAACCMCDDVRCSFILLMILISDIDI